MRNYNYYYLCLISLKELYVEDVTYVYDVRLFNSTFCRQNENSFISSAVQCFFFLFLTTTGRSVQFNWSRKRSLTFPRNDYK